MAREPFDFHDRGHYTMKRVQSLFDVCKKWDVDAYEFQAVVRLLYFKDRRDFSIDVDLLKIVKHFEYRARPVLRVLRFWRGHADSMEIMGSATCRSCGSGYPIDMLDSFRHGVTCPLLARD